MKVTEEMVGLASEALWAGKTVRRMLTEALRDVPEPGERVPGPFVLGQEERFACHGNATYMSVDDRFRILRAALDRAVRTLTVPAVEPLSDLLTSAERDWLDHYRKAFQLGTADAGRAFAIIDRLAPKPAPVQRTPEELGELVLRAQTPEAAQHYLDELVRLAETAPNSLTVEERGQVEAMRNTLPTPGSTKAALVEIIDRLASKPKPAQRTPEELAKALREQLSGSYPGLLPLVDELVRQANKAPK